MKDQLIKMHAMKASKFIRGIQLDAADLKQTLCFYVILLTELSLLLVSAAKHLSSLEPPLLDLHQKTLKILFILTRSFIINTVLSSGGQYIFDLKGGFRQA